MRCSVYIATSADGYIAAIDGDIEWLHTAGNSSADMGPLQDMGFSAFLNSVDCIIMGRNTIEVISRMNLTAEEWPYGNLPVIVLSTTLKTIPTLPGKVEIFSGEISRLITDLESRGLRHAYVDGGATITSFLNLKLIDEMTITRVPLLLGDGIPLFGRLTAPITLTNAEAVSFPNDFVQVKYRVQY